MRLVVLVILKFVLVFVVSRGDEVEKPSGQTKAGKQYTYVHYSMPKSTLNRQSVPITVAKRLSRSMTSPSWSPDSDYRLPVWLSPRHYDLYLHPDLSTDTFSGRVALHVDYVGSDAGFRWLPVHKHASVKVTATKLFEGNAQVDVERAFEHKENEFWVTVPKDPLRPGGSYRLELSFNGRLDLGIVGFYRSNYIDENGRVRGVASTKFQPTYARRAFPCFDEPSFKSTFTVTLVRPKDEYIALSNMPEEATRDDQPSPGLTEVTFEKSVPMVSYLVVVIICDFVCIESATPKYKIPFRVYGTRLQRNRLQYAMDIGRHITDYYQDYFNVKYPLPKLDMAAIPDYSSGATEHWGCITYRETALIFDEVESALANQKRVAEVIAHELTHQWFGNLMTTHWWNDLWLNEGFANYLMYKGVKSYETSWDTDSMFLTETMHSVLELDATLSSHPIVVNVDTPDQITAVFDAISYNKGSSVLRMLENFMGPQDFQRGLQTFLEKYRYKTAVTQNLFDELTEASSDKLNITKIMNTWTKQKGFPVVNIKCAKGDNYVLTQERFFANDDIAAAAVADEPSEYKYRWEIPLTYVTSSSPGERQLTWFPHEEKSVTIHLPSDVTWVKFNVGQYGYYRVNYPREDWRAFGALLQANANALPTSDRTALINDAFSLASAGQLDYASAFGMTQYLTNETEVAPWRVASTALGHISSILFYSDTAEPLAKYKQQLTRRLVESLGWADDGGFTKRQLRGTILAIACSAEDPACLEKAKELFLAWKNKGEHIPPNLRPLVYRYGIKATGDSSTWNWLLEKYKAEENAQEKLKLMEALTCIEKPAILYKLLTLAKDKSIVRDQDFHTLLIFMSKNRVGEQLVWDFVRNEWDYLVARFTLNDRYFGKMLADVTSRFATLHREKELETHFNLYPEAGAGENYRKIALETVRKNRAFVETQAKSITEWLLKAVEN